jgi:mRNA-degrading endonuclease RelE of RelBE toxin-antitoxin system
MAKTIPFTRRATEDLKALPRLVQEAVDATPTLMEAEPESFGKELRGRLEGLWSCRVGSYRIPYTLEGGKARTRVVARAIRHRGIAYPKRRGRR